MAGQNRPAKVKTGAKTPEALAHALSAFTEATEAFTEATEAFTEATEAFTETFSQTCETVSPTDSPARARSKGGSQRARDAG